jgi:hypothetical protein
MSLGIPQPAAVGLVGPDGGELQCWAALATVSVRRINARHDKLHG